MLMISSDKYRNPRHDAIYGGMPGPTKAFSGLAQLLDPIGWIVHAADGTHGLARTEDGRALQLAVHATGRTALETYAVHLA
jgi:hypothetical protein